MDPAEIPAPVTKPARRRKSKRAAKDPAAPKRPRTSLLSRIEALGPTHLDAYRVLSKGDPVWARLLAHAMGAEARVAAYSAAEQRASEALDAAHDRRVQAEVEKAVGDSLLKQIDTLARQIALARGEVPRPPPSDNTSA